MPAKLYSLFNVYDDSFAAFKKKRMRKLSFVVSGFLINKKPEVFLCMNSYQLMHGTATVSCS